MILFLILSRIGYHFYYCIHCKKLSIFYLSHTFTDKIYFFLNEALYFLEISIYLYLFYVKCFKPENGGKHYGILCCARNKKICGETHIYNGKIIVK